MHLAAAAVFDLLWEIGVVAYVKYGNVDETCDGFTLEVNEMG